MKLDFNSTHSTRYLQVYDYYKDLIVTGRLMPGTKMPSIRRGAVQLGLSRTTIETAYLCLAADGYIISRPQSGYYVTDRTATVISTQPVHNKNSDAADNPRILYNFTSNNVDADSFDFNLWRRYIKSTLRQDGRMLTYGEPQGEYELREVICRYVVNKRNAVCRPENIIIGAGSQALLNILCPLIKARETVCFHDTRFAQGMVIFEDYGFAVEKDKENASVLYMTPSHMTSLGDVMSVEKRLALLKECAVHNRLIIEDDYDSEFRYASRPIPALQGLDRAGRVVYMGTFSRSIAPAIRAAYLILPPGLLERYRHTFSHGACAVSRFEQESLRRFIAQGLYGRHLRRTGNLYRKKCALFTGALSAIPGASVSGAGAGLHFLLTLPRYSEEELTARAAEKSVRVYPLSRYCHTVPPKPSTVVLGFAGLSEDQLRRAAELLGEAWG